MTPALAKGILLTGASEQLLLTMQVIHVSVHQDRSYIVDMAPAIAKAMHHETIF